MEHIIAFIISFFSSPMSDEQIMPSPVLPQEISYTMPEESDPHEATWLQWPHQYQYGSTYRNRLDSTWVAMAKALSESEMVHIVAYNDEEKSRISTLLEKENIDMKKIVFTIAKTDDVWVRDNGPIYVKKNNGEIVIQDWGFNGWGEKAEYNKCNNIPKTIAQAQNKKYIDVNSIMINEGGSVEIDGNQTLMACKSSILNKNRNPNMTQEQAEKIFSQYLGVSNFIWLEGQAGLEITDQHIDGFARFGNKNTIVTMTPEDLERFDVLPEDIDILYAAKNKEGIPYTFIPLPLTKNTVTTEYGKNLGYHGSYVNYYIANTVVLVPVYQDPHDQEAQTIIQKIYPTRKVIGIDVRNLYENGGMIHCVTQQQPK